MCPHTSPKVFTSAYSYRVNVGNTVSRKLCTCVECFCQTSIYVIFLWKVQQENCSQRTRNLLFQSDNKSSLICSLFMCVCFLVAGCSHIFRNGKTISRTPLCCSRKNPTTCFTAIEIWADVNHSDINTHVNTVKQYTIYFFQYTKNGKSFCWCVLSDLFTRWKLQPNLWIQRVILLLHLVSTAR